jgi:hypothetical protein
MRLAVAYAAASAQCGCGRRLPLALLLRANATSATQKQASSRAVQLFTAGFSTVAGRRSRIASSGLAPAPKTTVPFIELGPGKWLKLGPLARLNHSDPPGTVPSSLPLPLEWQLAELGACRLISFKPDPLASKIGGVPADSLLSKLQVNLPSLCVYDSSYPTA